MAGGLLDRSARKSTGSKKKWTYKEDIIVLENYKESSDKELSKLLGGRHTHLSVAYRIRLMSNGESKLSQCKSLEELATYHKNHGVYDGE